MIRKTTIQPLLSNFVMPFQAQLSPDNRWVKLADLIPWDKLSVPYEALFPSHKGRPAKPARVVLGAMIIKHKLRLSDEETVEMIREHPYLQYFLGSERFVDQIPFVPSLFVEIRRRIGEKQYVQFEQVIYDKLYDIEHSRDEKSEDKVAVEEPMDDAGANKDDNDTDEVPPSNPTTLSGTLTIDATVAPQNIRYPTDQRLMNECREATESLIDELHAVVGGVKPRTYRRLARRQWLHYSKSRRPGLRERRSCIRRNLGYVRRNLKTIDRLLNQASLSSASLRTLWIVREVYRQQLSMFQAQSHSVEDRIVSLHQPHVRPIVRGKAGTPVEFGSKLSIGVSKNGFKSLDVHNWNAYNEGGFLIAQVEAYRERTGHYPQTVLADKIYGTRENRTWLKEHNIQYGGSKLGRPLADPAKRKQQAKAERKSEIERIEVERCISQAKTYGMGLVNARRCDTSYAWIAFSLFIPNLLILAKRAILLFKIWMDYCWNSENLLEAA